MAAGDAPRGSRPPPSARFEGRSSVFPEVGRERVAPLDGLLAGRDDLSDR